MKPIRREVQMVFQDPGESLNSRHTVGNLIGEAFDIHEVGDVEWRRRRVLELLEQVGLPGRAAERFPFEFSGGQRQRIGIARAIALEPKLVICDEPVSALDVSIQSQILNLLLELQEEMGLSYLFIAHDLSVVKHISDRIAIPEPDPARRGRPRVVLEGDVPSPINPPSGCVFHTRCPHAEARCSAEMPALRDVIASDGAGRQVACHFDL